MEAQNESMEVVTSSIGSLQKYNKYETETKTMICNKF